jgi:hypothetical protein
VRITIEPTGRCFTLDEFEVQVWHGETEGGVPCVVLVRRVMPSDEKQYTAFCREMDASDGRGPCGWK